MQVLKPIVRLLLHHGVTYQVLDEQVQRAFVAAAITQAGGEPQASDNRVSQLTGIHRRRLAELRRTPPPPRVEPSVALRVLMAASDRADLLNDRGELLPLPMSVRLGGDRSFEALVRAVAPDSRPRPLLDELMAAGLADLDDDNHVVLNAIGRRQRTVPTADLAHFMARMLGAHARAFTGNALGTGARRLCADASISGLSEADATELASALERAASEVLSRFNRLALERTRTAASTTEGTCTLTFGVYDWIDRGTARVAR